MNDDALKSLFVHTSRLHLLFSCLLLCVIALFLFGPSGHDDAHITYSAAKMLKDTGQLLNSNGERIEQSSSLLQVLLLATLYKISGVALPLLGIYLSLLCSIITLSLSFHWLKSISSSPYHSLSNRALPLYLISISTAFVYWSTGGLESSLTSCCILWLLINFYHVLHSTTQYKHYLLLTIALGTWLMVRPEAYFVTLTFLGGFFILGLRETQQYRKAIIITAIIASLLFALLCLWRYDYFNQVFAQPVFAKFGHFSLNKIGFGFIYFVYPAQLSIIIFTLSLLVAKMRWFKKIAIHNTGLTLCTAFIASYLAFIVFSGGDWMGGGRFFSHILPLLAISFVYYTQDFTYAKPLYLFVIIIMLIELIFFSKNLALGIPLQRSQAFAQSFEHAVNTQGFSWPEKNNAVHLLDIQFINQLSPVIEQLNNHKKPLIIASVQMGMTPFYLRQRFNEQVYFIDMRGLSTQHLSHCESFAKAPRIWTGIFINYTDYFAAQAQGKCQLPRIDIIYDLLNNINPDFNTQQIQRLEKNGYRIIYTQSGSISDLSGNMQLDSRAYIAIRSALYSQLPQALQQQEFTLNNTLKP